jgi:hypothetical protein
MEEKQVPDLIRRDARAFGIISIPGMWQFLACEGGLFHRRGQEM